jgi:hypothetical protein
MTGGLVAGRRVGLTVRDGRSFRGLGSVRGLVRIILRTGVFSVIAGIFGARLTAV